MKHSQLNAAQRLAVAHGEGPALVVAGAGTGKTRVITERIARLIEDKAARPDQILALTFTEKAAREMAERLYDLIGWRSYQIAVQTFHGFGAELLASYGLHIGRSVRGGLINDAQKTLLLLQNLERVSLSYYGSQARVSEFLEAVVEHINQLQNAGISAERYAEYVNNLSPSDALHPSEIAERRDVSTLFSLYEKIKEETGTLDYNDQLTLPLRILQQKPNLASRLSSQYRFVLVDEYQDTNKAQDELLRAFVSSTGNIFAVGDDDQAIYGFRGAEIGNILDFADHYDLKQPIALVENYRSGQEILDASHRLIAHNNPNRLEVRLGLDKRLRGQSTGSVIDFNAYSSPSDELEGVQKQIQSELFQGAEPVNIAVLSSTHAPLKRLARRLRAAGLPFALSTTVDIFDQPELNQLWYLLQWIGMRADEESLGHVMLSPFFGWSAEQYRQLLSESRDGFMGVEESLRDSAARGGKEASGVIEKLDRWREWAKDAPVSYLSYRLVFETGVADALRSRAADQLRIKQVFDDLAQLLNHMQDYETVARDRTLVGYLQNLPKQPQIEVTEPVGDSQGVQLLTVHASKGLEFDTVFLIGCTQYNWSPKRGTGWVIPEELLDAPELPPEHELRRLMYVAVTRARRRLVISAATTGAGGGRQTVSPFVAELFGSMPKISLSKPSASDQVEKSVNKLQRFYPLKAQMDEKLPFELGDGWLELGVSALARYNFCPYDFFLEQVLGISQPFGPQLAFGTALHGVIQRYYQAILRNEKVDDQELVTLLDELWNDRGYPTRQQAENAKSAAQNALHNFLARERLRPREIVAAELPIRLELPESKLRLRGRIDAIFKTERGVELRDFKTGRKTNAESLAKEAKSSFQLRSYALAYQQIADSAIDAVVLDYVVTGVEASADLSSRILENHRSKLNELANAIRSRDFAPKNTHLHNCAAIRYYGSPDNQDNPSLLEMVGEN